MKQIFEKEMIKSKKYIILSNENIKNFFIITLMLFYIIALYGFMVACLIISGQYQQNIVNQYNIVLIAGIVFVYFIFGVGCFLNRNENKDAKVIEKYDVIDEAEQDITTDQRIELMQLHKESSDAFIKAYVEVVLKNKEQLEMDNVKIKIEDMKKGFYKEFLNKFYLYKTRLYFDNLDKEDK